MTPTVPARAGGKPDDNRAIRGRQTAFGRRDEIARQQGFASYWHKRQHLANLRENTPRELDARRTKPPADAAGEIAGAA